MGVVLDNVTLSLVGGQTTGAPQHHLRQQQPKASSSQGPTPSETSSGATTSVSTPPATQPWATRTSPASTSAQARPSPIGGWSPDHRLRRAANNVISGNLGRGILIAGSRPSPPPPTAFGNYIGLAADGLASIGNTAASVSTAPKRISSAPSTAAATTSAARPTLPAATALRSPARRGQQRHLQQLHRRQHRRQCPQQRALASPSAARSFTFTGGVNGRRGQPHRVQRVRGRAGHRQPTHRELHPRQRDPRQRRPRHRPAANGVTPNGPAGPARVGPNELQNYPVIQSTNAGAATASSPPSPVPPSASSSSRPLFDPSALRRRSPISAS